MKKIVFFKKRDAIAIDDDSASEEPVRKSAKNEKKVRSILCVFSVHSVRNARQT